MNIEEARANIREILESRIEFRGKRAICPFHDDTRPSLSVHDKKMIWKCFACGEGGDVFTFLMKYHNVGFKEALKIAHVSDYGVNPNISLIDKKYQEIRSKIIDEINALSEVHRISNSVMNGASNMDQKFELFLNSLDLENELNELGEALRRLNEAYWRKRKEIWNGSI